MSGHLAVMAGAAFGIAVLMLLALLVAAVHQRTRMTHIVWGVGLVAVAWISSLIGEGNDARMSLLLAMVTVWGVRLVGYRSWRSRRRDDPPAPATWFAAVFAVEGVVMFVVGLPVMLAATPATPAIGWLAVVGVALWGTGFFLEAVGEVQLGRFHDDPGNEDAVMNRGLWRHIPHPPLIGAACVWWGIFLVAAEAADARFGVIGPILMTFLLRRRSGAPLSPLPEVISSDV